MAAIYEMKDDFCEAGVRLITKRTPEDGAMVNRKVAELPQHGEETAGRVALHTAVLSPGI
jgi:hypothetical protein